jgi:hypothetical protein
VEWVTWFEVGIMNHWRDVKDWLLGWLPFFTPWWFIEYFILGSAYARAVSVSLLDQVRENLGEESWKREWTEVTILQRTAWTMLSWFISVLTWPIFLTVLPFLLLPNSHRVWRVLENEKLTKKYFTRISRLFFTSLLCFVPILFVLSDFISRFSQPNG